MTMQKTNKLNQLGNLLPEGLLVNASWLEQQGYSSSLRNQYVSAGWLTQPARGVFCRPRGIAGWEQAVISLQTLVGLPVSVGGRTALELQGYAHYLLQSQQAIHLYADEKLPGWVFKLPIDQSFIFHNRLRFLPKTAPLPDSISLSAPVSEKSDTTLDGALRINQWGQWHWPMIISTPERAYLELLDELPQHETFHMADVIMEGLVNLSPRRMQALLEQATSIKVKRLFFFFAERHNHRWLKHINREAIDLGKGKRMLAKGGKLDPTFQITVPEDLDGIH